mmetsp:Transcript_2151/g.3782  ORF Transcript_2151/g.3782 Transcript_2151/m.3782 type:complete len:247 (-) Transcript_2151:52-792(-)
MGRLRDQRGGEHGPLRRGVAARRPRRQRLAHAALRPQQPAPLRRAPPQRECSRAAGLARRRPGDEALEWQHGAARGGADGRARADPLARLARRRRQRDERLGRGRARRGGGDGSLRRGVGAAARGGGGGRRQPGRDARDGGGPARPDRAARAAARARGGGGASGAAWLHRSRRGGAGQPQARLRLAAAARRERERGRGRGARRDAPRRGGVRGSLPPRVAAPPGGCAAQRDQRDGRHPALPRRLLQ